MNSTWIVRSDVDGTIQSALITADRGDVLVATSRNIASGGNNGTAVVQILEIQAASSRPVRVLRPGRHSFPS